MSPGTVTLLPPHAVAASAIARARSGTAASVVFFACLPISGPPWGGGGESSCADRRRGRSPAAHGPLTGGRVDEITTPALRPGRHHHRAAAAAADRLGRRQQRAP